MLRTRDLILFMLVFFFLSIAIATTVIRGGSESLPAQDIAFNDSEFQQGAISEEKTLDRASVLDRLRSKIANSSELIEPSASVESPEVPEEIDQVGSGLQKCLYPDDALSMVPRWPLSNVKVSVREGARVVYSEDEVVVPISTNVGTSSVVSEEVVVAVLPLLQLPVLGQKQSEVSCVPSEVVGVTSGGILMFNGDVNSYRKIPENALIGYARDGFPIYGVYEGKVDSCGGYDHPSGYRYVISTERDYIVGCYVGTVSKFTL